MWGQGAVTLPKKWRSQFDTKHFLAMETSEGLLIQPILSQGAKPAKKASAKPKASSKSKAKPQPASGGFFGMFGRKG
jgi:hypothetical protein